MLVELTQTQAYVLLKRTVAKWPPLASTPLRGPIQLRIKHGEIGTLEDSTAAPEKVLYQYMGKNQN